MAEQSNSGALVAVGIGVGLLVGTIFTYIVFKSRDAQPVQTAMMHPVDAETLRQMSAEVANLSKLVTSLTQENSALKIQLAAARDVKPQILEAPKIQMPSSATSTYKNNEKRIYERGRDGFIKSIHIVRDAKVNAAG